MFFSFSCQHSSNGSNLMELRQTKGATRKFPRNHQETGWWRNSTDAVNELWRDWGISLTPQSHVVSYRDKYLKFPSPPPLRPGNVWSNIMNWSSLSFINSVNKQSRLLIITTNWSQILKVGILTRRCQFLRRRSTLYLYIYLLFPKFLSSI